MWQEAGPRSMLGGGEACAPKDLDEKMEHSRLHYCQIIECGVGV